MSLILELLNTHADNQQNDENLNDREFDPDDDADQDQQSDDFNDTESDSGDDGIDHVADAASADPDKQGVIRTIDGAKLIYKRKSDDGAYEELWVCGSTNPRRAYKIKRDILAGTDIDNDQQSSTDSSQRQEIWNVGNVQFVKISGLPN